MHQIWGHLVETWRSQGLPIQNGCTERELAAFESHYKIVLPSDLREYLGVTNGMNDGDQDEEGFSFWPLENMRTLTEEIEAQGSKDSWRLEEQDSLFVFCDYLIWSWAYAIKISRNSSKVDGVYLVCCSDPVKVTESFSDFVRLYLEKSEKLYPPSDHEHI